MNLFRTKNINEIIDNVEHSSLKKSLGAVDLILLGIGCTIGTGIFVLTGIGAAKYAGPAISLSYLFSAFACAFAALAYAELASMVPASGSAYTYTYAVIGEFLAWLVGWGLILEYGVGAATVASGWSGYMVGILNTGGIHLPEYLIKTPADGGIINLPAVLIALFIGLLLIRGTKESVVFNRILVGVKLTAIFIFLVVATPMVKTTNWIDFMPFGIHGIFLGAATIFFAYIGFDAVATAAEECKNPKRDLPIGIIGSLAISALLYVAVALVLTGIADYKLLDNAEPLAFALRINGSNIGSALVAVGAITGMTTVLLVLMYGQSRIFFVMSRDKLIPGFFNKIHPRFNTPYISAIIVAFAVALTSGLTPIHTLGHMTSLGTLFAFVVVAVGVMVLRKTRPDLARPFRCPAVNVVAPMAVLTCGYLIYNLLLETGKPFLIWSVIGLIIYFSYSYRNSPLNKK
ncbi:MAG: yhdG 1 [Rickettsiaceae bacterium]|nr:yhdG 1 [Rickettsiaceae bacterium]